MKKKYFWNLMTILMVTLSLGFASCGSDDDENVRVQQQLVGIWKTSMSSSNWRCIELESNGTLHYSMYIKDNGEIYYSSWAESEKAHWTYNESDQTISMFTDDGYYAYTFKVNMADDGKSWAGIYTNSKGGTETYSFVKVDGKGQMPTSNN